MFLFSSLRSVFKWLRIWTIQWVETLLLYLFFEPGPKPATRVSFTVRLSDGTTFPEDTMDIQVRKGQQLVITPNFYDADGNPTSELGSKPEWFSRAEGILNLEVSEDGMTCVATPTGVLGTTTIEMIVDADPSEGVSALVGTLEVNVKAGLATTVRLNATVQAVPAPAPEPEPEPEPAPAPSPEVPAETPVEEPAPAPAPAPEEGSGDEATPPDQSPENGGDTQASDDTTGTDPKV